MKEAVSEKVVLEEWWSLTRVVFMKEAVSEIVVLMERWAPWRKQLKKKSLRS